MIIQIIVILIIVGAVLYVLPQIPIDATIKLIIKVIIIVAVVIWLLRTLPLGL